MSAVAQRFSDRMGRLIAVLHLGAVLCVVAWLYPMPSPPAAWWPVLMLFGLALAAEMLPVSVPRLNLRITLSLPFVAGLALAAGPLGAVIGDLLVTTLAPLILAARNGDRVQPRWLWANASVSVLSAGSACAAMIGIATVTPSGPFWHMAGHLSFVLIYAAVNFALVTHVSALATSRSFRDNAVSKLKPGLLILFLYLFVGLGVLELVEYGYTAFAPFMLVPVLMVRHALRLKAEMFEHYYESVVGLMLMLQRVHPYTKGHMERVAQLSEQVGLKLGLSPARAGLLREAAVLHDIGKIAIDERILDKPARLTADEMKHVQLHPGYGAEILSHCAHFAAIVPWVRHHHERPDGTGYPSGLQDADIPVESKIIAVVDAYDAMVGGSLFGERRSYRKPMTRESALQELDRCSGTQFDARVVGAFREVLFRLEGD